MAVKPGENCWRSRHHLSQSAEARDDNVENYNDGSEHNDGSGQGLFAEEEEKKKKKKKKNKAPFLMWTGDRGSQFDVEDAIMNADDMIVDP